MNRMVKRWQDLGIVLLMYRLGRDLTASTRSSSTSRQDSDDYESHREGRPHNACFGRGFCCLDW